MDNTVKSVQRIENTWIWDNYTCHKRKMQFKNSGVVNETLLFHGTSTTTPETIYMGEVGFDHRFCKKGRLLLTLRLRLNTLIHLHLYPLKE